MSHVLAADIGGTNIRLAIIDAHGNIIDESRVQADLSQHTSTSTAQAEIHIIDTLAKAMQPMLNQSNYPIEAIGMGFPGFFRGDTGVLAASPNLPLLKNFALAKLLGDALKTPVAVQNDALCAAIGEHRFGAGQGKNNLLHITLGTGVGGGLILNHQSYTGEHGMAMEFGHVCVVQDNGRLCGCGNVGCVEAYASASAIKQRYAEATGSDSNAKAIYQLACDGDHHAINILQQAGAYLGKAMAEAIKLLDISTITVSGGLSGAWPIIHPALMNTLNMNLIAPLKGQVQVFPSKLGDNAGLLGAASIASTSS